jgi:hypothetical protein
VPVLSFDFGGRAYSFDITSVTIVSQTSTTLDLTGKGIAAITGFQDTLGTWTLTDAAEDATHTFNFSATVPTAAPATLLPEPDPALLMLIGAGSFGLARCARRGLRRLTRQ